MLYQRIIKQGTINEKGGKPEPQFALLATVNWMRALKILAKDEIPNFETASSFYRNKGRCSMGRYVENTVLEQLFLGLHHLSALQQLRSGAIAADFARIGVLAWYYGIANAASAMTAAQSGAFQEDHAGTANVWDEQIAKRGLAMPPFNWRLSSLVEKVYKPEVDALRNGSSGGLHRKPTTKQEALGAAAEYLSGSGAWYACKIQADLRRNRAFKDLGVDDFRSKRARSLKDERLAKKPIGFMHQAMRYRGKANYREALFLAYGNNTEASLANFIDDMHDVLEAFLVMAGAFSSRKLGKDLWIEFVADIDSKKAFSARAGDVWS